jgi:broad specificity phosphatase PhoE
MKLFIKFLMESTVIQQVKDDCLVFWVRHGERVDHVDYEALLDQPEHIKYDSPLSELGKQQAYEAGIRIKESLAAQGYAGSPITILVSPLLRTL